MGRRLTSGPFGRIDRAVGPEGYRVLVDRTIELIDPLRSDRQEGNTPP